MPHPSTANHPANRLLASMACEDLAHLEGFLEPALLKFRQQLEIANRPIRNAYFVERGLASVVATSRGARLEAEVGIVGFEGMTGLALVLGLDRSPHTTFMQVEGQGQCISADNLRRVLDKRASLKAHLLRYVHVFSIQAGHTALANARGSVPERLARWLLMAHDSAEHDEIRLTHEFLALMLGVRRAGVTTALHLLEDRRAISTARGSLTVVDRGTLEKTANGLYGVPETEFDRLFA
jgi:CRP-like cAMP-binding protein